MRIVSSPARSCVEDMTGRRLDLDPQPTLLACYLYVRYVTRTLYLLLHAIAYAKLRKPQHIFERLPQPQYSVFSPAQATKHVYTCRSEHDNASIRETQHDLVEHLPHAEQSALHRRNSKTRPCRSSATTQASRQGCREPAYMPSSF